MTKGVTSKHRGKDKQEVPDYDPLMRQKATKINFVTFMMFFYTIKQVDALIMKPIFSSKQRKLSHLICIFGHQYLLKDVLKQIDMYHHNCLNKHVADHERSMMNVSSDFTSSRALRILQTQYQFLNSVDRDFSTPLILAMKNKRMGIVRMLLDHPKTCLKQSSMKYGTPLHVVLANHEFNLAVKVMRMMKNIKEFNELP